MSGWDILISGGVAGVILAVGNVLFRLMTGWHVAGRQTRADAITEWQQIAQNLRNEIGIWQLEANAVRDAWSQDVRRMQQELQEMRDQNSQCERDRIKLEVEIRHLQDGLQTLRARGGSDTSTSNFPAVIVYDTQGVIRDVGPGISPLLHWLPKDLIGKRLETIVPPRRRARVQEGLREILTNGQPGWQERVILTEALTRDGREIPVVLTLTAWQDEKGGWLVSATMRRRDRDSKPDEVQMHGPAEATQPTREPEPETTDPVKGDRGEP